MWNVNLKSNMIFPLICRVSSCMHRYHVCLSSHMFSRLSSILRLSCSIPWFAPFIAVCFTWLVLPICIVTYPMHVLLVMLCNFLSFAFCTSNSYSTCRATLLALELCMLYPTKMLCPLIPVYTAYEPAYLFVPMPIHSWFPYCLMNYFAKRNR